MSKDYIQLQNSHVTQHTNGHIKSDWEVQENISNDILCLFPNTVNEELMFKITDFAKEFELKAFNSGIKLGKEKTVAVYEPKIKQMEEAIKQMKSENVRLSEALEEEMLKGMEND